MNIIVNDVVKLDQDIEVERDSEVEFLIKEKHVFGWSSTTAYLR